MKARRNPINTMKSQAPAAELHGVFLCM